MTFEDGPLLAELGAAGITSELLTLPERTRDLRRAQLATRVPWRAVVDTVVQTDPSPGSAGCVPTSCTPTR